MTGRRVGITTTVPVEVLFAAGVTPVDLNNVFINRPDAAELVQSAELDGYPRSVCGWIKGIYATTLAENIDTIVAVVEGDCSQTHAMVETLRVKGVRAIPFSYPYGRDADMLRLQIGRLIETFGTTWDEAERWKTRLDGIRRKVRRIDELTWQTGQVSGFENHLYQISCSDFEGNPDAFEARCDAFLVQAAERPACQRRTRIGVTGIPPIYTDFYEAVDSLGMAIVFNELQRQFAMPFETDDLVSQYLAYTYPYDIFGRIEDIQAEVRRRRPDGLIHYVQSFCFRQIQDQILRQQIHLPFLTVEGEHPGKLDARTRMRLESFAEMLAR